MTILTDLLIAFSPWILFLGEIYLGKRVYNATRRRFQLHQRMAQLRLVATASLQSFDDADPPNSEDHGSPHRPPGNPALLMMLREQLPPIPSPTWERAGMVVVVANVFILTYSTMSLLLRPIANRAMLSLISLCLPLAVVPIPYLVCLKPGVTLLVLVTILGCSFLMLVLVGV